eukprot:snap_masked-scaffold_11-processed-gene-6.48-mRNA-1 protein AED:1.00 eAED:1.00 QI:0/0/0/0/1/1/3/0/60
MCCMMKTWKLLGDPKTRYLVSEGKWSNNFFAQGDIFVKYHCPELRQISWRQITPFITPRF